MRARAVARIAAVATLAAAGLGYSGCSGKEPVDSADSSDTDTDTDSDSDSDSDTAPGCVDGFQASAADLALPSGFDATLYPAEALQTPSGSRTCASGSGTYVWSHPDLDGNGALDLSLHFDDCGTDSSLGATHWSAALAGDSGMADLTAWTLPTVFDSDHFPDNALNASSGTRTCPDGTSFVWAMSDLTGDGKPDLVLPYDTCGTTTGVGTGVWEVYANTGAGFAETATAWTLPAVFATSVYPSSALNSMSGTRTFGSCSYVWSVTDMDGDDRPDLVLPFDSCTGSGTVGTTSWTVHLNTGSGFSGTPEAFALPSYGSNYPASPFNNTSGTRTCVDTTQSFSWTLSDLDGDNRPDLVVPFDTCGTETDIGGAEWRVHMNTGAGFGSAVAFTLPAGYGASPYPDDAFYALSGTRSCSDGGSFVWASSDINGDGRADLVMPYNTCGASLEPGSRFWRVHLGDGIGFSDEEAQWTLPPAYTSGEYPAAPINLTSGTRTCDNGGYYAWELGDQDGDAVQDLLVTADTCAGDAGLGSTKWLVYPGGCF